MRIEQRLKEALAALPSLERPLPATAVQDLIGRIPLLSGLPGNILQRLASCAKPVTFLPGDTVIGQSERGDALYVIISGRVAVYRNGLNGQREQLAELADGDFFGETALLGDQVRTASVIARKASTLLRLRRRDIMQLAETEPLLRRRLEEAARERSRP